MSRLLDILKMYKWVLATFVTGVVLLLFAMGARSYTEHPDNVARTVERHLEHRLGVLDQFIEKASQPDSTGWMDIGELPEDMVLYRYMYDTLQSWHNQFPVTNDDIRSRFVYQRLSRPEYGISSPLADIPHSWSYVNLGTKWYVAKAVTYDRVCEIIAGLEVCRIDADGQTCDVNRFLAVPDRYEVFPLAGNIGKDITVDGQKVFLLNGPFSDQTLIFANSLLRWFGLVFLVLATVLYLRKRRQWGTFVLTSTLLVVFYLIAQYWGSQMQDTSRLFSPLLYAGGNIWSSFGALIILNTLIMLLIVSVFTMREKMAEWAGKSRVRMGIYMAGIILAFIAGIVYLVLSLIDICVNSSISLEMRWFHDGVVYTLIALFMYTLMVETLVMMLQMLAPAVKMFFGKELNMMTPTTVMVASVLAAVLFFSMSAGYGFKKEQSRAQTWANRLAVDRDLELELMLRTVEEPMAADQVIAILSSLDDMSSVLANRIAENYLFRAVNDYDVTVSACSINDMDCEMLFNRKMMSGTQIASGSRFVCIYHDNGRSSYAGLFSYLAPEDKVTRVLVELISKASREDVGYSSVFRQLGRPGVMTIPETYSYAKFVDGRLVSYRGTYAYPTYISDEGRQNLSEGKSHFTRNSYIHFVNNITDNEVIIISRPRKTLLQEVSSSLAVLAIILLILCPITFTTRKREETSKNTFRKRINVILTAAISVSLICLASISIKFVFDRSKSDTYNMMSSRVMTAQTMVESLIQNVPDYTALLTQEFNNNLLDMANTTHIDITLYNLSGRMFMSSVPDLYERSAITPRMSDEAFYEIVHNHQRLYIVKEEVDGKKYRALYAPVFNRNDDMVAILCTPYSGMSNLMKEAVPHAVLLFILVLTLLALFASLTSKVVNAVFAPLTEISKKMEGAATTTGLELIDYSHDDEISALISSYNRMVNDLRESAKVMARNERDMAWSEMARQVAHEIKNPLTPMKLAIQRLIRLKDKNDPAWVEKFDDLSTVILEQIDNLTETANDFSTFAKLYSEEPVEVDLDKMLQEQILVFDNKENITISYIGMRDALIMAPRPQLIRVVVNLITNSVQAIEIDQQEAAESGREVKHGQINILLRNSSKEDCYDIVIEDNGPGVPEENIEKLFTPKFTTKSAGSGLGLAISRNIIEKCNGEIRYKKSFTLDGAGFEITLPKKA